jgi:hypothetical protein
VNTKMKFSFFFYSPPISEEAVPSLQRGRWWGKLNKFIYAYGMTEELETAVTSKSSIQRFDELELNSCVIKSKEDFNIPEIEVSSLEKLDLNIKFAVQAKDFKKAFKKDRRFCNVIEANLFLDCPFDEDINSLDTDYRDEQNDLAVALLKSIPNVKKLNIASYYKLNIKSLETLVTKCRKLESLTLETLEDEEIYSKKTLGFVIPYICEDLKNLRFLHIKDWCIHWKYARYLLLHSQQLQAVLNNEFLMVRSTAQMSEVARFLEEDPEDCRQFSRICFY